ncbi:MAG TPA: formimidoylglutamase, partial [Bacteroidia bacterium]|nr:formimidoylglutamase [Bacteroidia bacterium]
MEIEQYLTPAKIERTEYESFMWGSHVKQFKEKEFPKLDGVKVAIIGVGEDRNAGKNKGCAAAPDKIREGFYSLSCVEGLSVADLGNIVPGNKASDTYHALSFICSELLDRKIVPFIIGGSQELTYANYLAYQRQQQTVNIVCIDRKLDLGTMDAELDSNSYLNKILQHEPNLLFNFSLVGYQTHFMNTSELESMNKMYFDLYRLGQLQANLEEAEPFVRNADIMSFDISSIRRSDAPGTFHSTPNGLYGEEACQVFRYAGMSDKLSSIGIYEVNPLFDNRNQTTELAAQLIWYFLEGFSNRKSDFPDISEKDYIKY